ncbi:hypothetical protein COF68_05720 [Bacillus toyonensis]|uniref:hypothetical protein n=1 Tax=Bacillus toyonensis TaxID=155322 RepID=UPI000BFB3619|nr:hypothetical protein [Bacillus toyonensis]PHE64338.1 hypothetical protein COF68_05720 [Bacillus toyonensis]
MKTKEYDSVTLSIRDGWVHATIRGKDFLNGELNHSFDLDFMYNEFKSELNKELEKLSMKDLTKLHDLVYESITSKEVIPYKYCAVAIKSLKV